MVKRMILMLVGVAVFVGAVATVKFRQIQMGAAQAASFQPPPEAVTTLVAGRESWPQAISAIGTAVAIQGVTVSADLPGIVSRIAFESGARVEKGAVLVELDARQEQAQLTAAEAQLELARQNLDRTNGLRDAGDHLPGGERPRGRGAQAGRGAGRGDSRDPRPQDDQGALRGRPGHPPGQPRPVPASGRPRGAAAGHEPHLRQLHRAPSRTCRSCESGARCRSRSRAWTARESRGGSPPSTPSSTRRRATSRSRRRSRTRTAACARACS